MTTGPQISVVVPVRDGASALPALLASLEAQTLDRDRFEVIVVDNASRDDTANIARKAGAIVVEEPLPNRARARNRGTAAATTDLIACTDADCVASQDWLEALLACRGRAPLIAGPVRVTTSEDPNLVERFERLSRFGQEHWVKEGWAATANLCVERDALEAVGGFDSQWRHAGEDVDLCIRAGRRGFSLGWCPDAVVSHYAEDEVWPMMRRAFFYGYGVNQAHYRLGLGDRPWRHPRPLIDGDRALGLIGARADSFDTTEWRRLRRIGRGMYGARMLGSLWAELRLAR